jgi:hypothetical protein
MSQAFLPWLIGDKVQECEYIEGYVYLVLEGAFISLFNPILGSWTREHVIGATLMSMDLRASEWLRFTFSSGEVLTLSLRLEDYSGPEAAYFKYRKQNGSLVL